MRQIGCHHSVVKGHRRVSIRLLFGIVGAGGIGLQLSEQIRTYDFDQVAFIVLLIAARSPSSIGF